MSLVDLIVQRNAAYLLTDSGYFEAGSTRIKNLAPKAISRRKGDMAFANVGVPLLPIILRDMGDQLEADDFTLDTMTELLRNAYTTLDRDPDTDGSIVLCAGYSQERGRAFGYSMLAGGIPPEGAKRLPWTWYPTRHMLIPSVTLKELWGYDVPVDLTDPDIFDPFDDSMSLVEPQRRKRTGWGSDCAVSGCAIAGEIHLTEVSADGVKIFDLHDFGDRVGELAGQRSAGRTYPALRGVDRGPS